MTTTGSNAETHCSEVESTKSVSDFVSPVAGTFAESSTVAVAEPEMLTSDPTGTL